MNMDVAPIRRQQQADSYRQQADKYHQQANTLLLLYSYSYLYSYWVIKICLIPFYDYVYDLLNLY